MRPDGPPQTGGLTESGFAGMIPAVTRRGVRLVEPNLLPLDAPGQEYVNPLRLPTTSRPMSEQSPAAVPRGAQRAPADRASQKEYQ